VLTDEQLAWVEHLRQVRADLKTIKAREEEVASYLKAVLGQRNTGIYNGKVIVTTTSHPGRDKIDSKLLKSRYPDVFAAVASKGDGYRTLSVK
jgi:predicted phage-related endonuclease